MAAIIQLLSYFFFDDRQVSKAVVKMYAVYKAIGKSLHTVCKINV